MLLARQPRPPLLVNLYDLPRLHRRSFGRRREPAERRVTQHRSSVAAAAEAVAVNPYPPSSAATRTPGQRTVARSSTRTLGPSPSSAQRVTLRGVDGGYDDGRDRGDLAIGSMMRSKRRDNQRREPFSVHGTLTLYPTLPSSVSSIAPSPDRASPYLCKTYACGCPSEHVLYPVAVVRPSPTAAPCSRAGAPGAARAATAVLL